MGFTRKMISPLTFGAVKYHSNAEKTARYAKKGWKHEKEREAREKAQLRIANEQLRVQREAAQTQTIQAAQPASPPGAPPHWEQARDGAWWWWDGARWVPAPQRQV